MRSARPGPARPTPRPARSVRRPVATSTRAATERRPVGQVQRWHPAAPEASTRSIVAPVCTSTPFLAQDLGEQLGGLRLLGGRRCGRPSRRWSTCAPNRAIDLADLETDRRRPRRRGATPGTVFSGDGLPIRPVRHLGEHRRHPGPGPGGERRAPCAAVIGLAADLDRRRAGDPGPAPDEATALALEAVDGHRVVPRSPSPPPGCAAATGAQSGVTTDEPAMPGMRRPSARRSAARTIILDGMQPQ